MKRRTIAQAPLSLEERLQALTAEAARHRAVAEGHASRGYMERWAVEMSCTRQLDRDIARLRRLINLKRQGRKEGSSETD